MHHTRVAEGSSVALAPFRACTAVSLFAVQMRSHKQRLTYGFDVNQQIRNDTAYVPEFTNEPAAAGESTALWELSCCLKWSVFGWTVAAGQGKNTAIKESNTFQRVEMLRLRAGFCDYVIATANNHHQSCRHHSVLQRSQNQTHQLRCCHQCAVSTCSLNFTLTHVADLWMGQTVQWEGVCG